MEPSSREPVSETASQPADRPGGHRTGHTGLVDR